MAKTKEQRKAKRQLKRNMDEAWLIRKFSESLFEQASQAYGFAVAQYVHHGKKGTELTMPLEPTQGEWTFDADTFVVRAGKVLVAGVYNPIAPGKTRYTKFEERAANGYLIAAAPQMLAELKACLLVLRGLAAAGDFAERISRIEAVVSLAERKL